MKYDPSMGTLGLGQSRPGITIVRCTRSLTSVLASDKRLNAFWKKLMGRQAPQFNPVPSQEYIVRANVRVHSNVTLDPDIARGVVLYERGSRPPFRPLMNPQVSIVGVDGGIELYFPYSMFSFVRNLILQGP